MCDIYQIFSTCLCVQFLSPVCITTTPSSSSFLRVDPPPYLGRLRDPRLGTHPGISLVGRENTLHGLTELQLV